MNFNEQLQTVDSIETLIQTNPAGVGADVFVEGRFRSGDDGASTGIYRFYYDSVAPPNGVTIFAPTSWPGRWKQLVGKAGYSQTTQRIIAGQAIGSPRIVMIDAGQAYLFDPSDEDNYWRVLGITQTSAAMGGELIVVQAGMLEAVGGFVQDHIYFAGAAGTLTVFPPSIPGISMKVCYAITADLALVALSTPLIIV